MADIKIYTATYCPYCVKAKELLKRKGYKNFKEIDVTDSDELRLEMTKKAGGRKTVPQIFINDKHIGGCDDIYALDSKGELDKILSA